jgi:hypothetical protein
VNREERRARAVEWHRFYERTGFSMSRVARGVGVDRKTTERSFKRYGLPTRPPPRGRYEPEWYPDVE